MTWWHCPRFVRHGRPLWRPVITAAVAVVMVMALAPMSGQAADDTTPAGRQLPSGSHIPGIKRLPNGQIVVADPQEESPTSLLPTRPASVMAAAPKPAMPSIVATVPPPAAPSPAALTRIADCPSEAITCLRVTGGSTSVEALPVTFGQPFKPGDVPSHASLVGRDGKGNQLALQLDGRATHADGSLRFAVISAVLPKVAAHEARTVAILRGEAPPPSPNATGMPAFDLMIELRIFSDQVTVVKFGDRRGEKLGTPFTTGETITLEIGAERFSLTVTPAMSGGNMTPYMTIAKAFVPLINARSKRFRARWNDANDGYEKLWITTIDHAEAFPVTADHDGPATISIQPYLSVEKPEIWVATLGTGSKGKAWLDGPVAKEQDIALPLISKTTGEPHPQLSARLHLRSYPSARASRADVVLENGWAYAPGPRNYTYDIAIRRNGAAVYSHANVNHTHHARWHTLIWSEGFDEPAVTHHIPTLLDSRAVPHFDPRLSIAEGSLQQDAQALAKTDTGPLGTAQVTLYMPTTGGRADIGPLPRWAVIYLLTMDPRARTILFANADAGAGIPIHYRDRKTDLPVSLDDHPTVVMGPGRPNSPDAFPAVVIGDTPWTPQIAHHPSLAYLPYLLSGDLFYLEEVTYWADWVLASVDPGYREGAKGLIAANEVRGQAWSLRTLGEAAVILPDNHPMKAYFNDRLRGNIAWYLKHFVNNPDPEQSPVLGIIPKPDDPGIMSPWQQDYLFLAVGHLAEQGIPGAEEILRWLARFSIGRWTSDTAGFCHQMAPAYYIKIRDSNKRFSPSLRDLFTLNWPEAKSCPPAFPFGDPASAGGYVANAHAALAIAADFKIVGASEAFDRLRGEAPLMVRAFADNPTFAIVPRK